MWPRASVYRLGGGACTMPFTPQLETWLKSAGYKNHCFISFARASSSPEMLDYARRVRDAVKSELAVWLADPQVFLDESSIPGGTDWQKTLSAGLCRSVAMVAICTPMYYHPAHPWCAREWAAMEQLSEVRLPSDPQKTIIPVMFRLQTSLPMAVSKIQHIDFSKVATSGWTYFRTADFKKKILQIVDRIAVIAEALQRDDRVPSCDKYQIPDAAPFADYHAPKPSLPLRS
jgi:hypothetical protein